MRSVPATTTTTSKSKFTPVDAARLACSAAYRPPGVTPRNERLLDTSALLWCRNQQFPTVRDIQLELGLRSTSSVVAGFDGLVSVQAAVIHREWRAIAACWAPTRAELTHWIACHAEQLARADEAFLRLPGSVWSAVTTVKPSTVAAWPGLGPPLLVLGALAHVGADLVDRGALVDLLQSAQRLIDRPPADAVPA